MIINTLYRAVVHGSAVGILMVCGTFAAPSWALDSDAKALHQADTYEQVSQQTLVPRDAMDQIEIFVELEQSNIKLTPFAQAVPQTREFSSKQVQREMSKLASKEMPEKSNQQGQAWRVNMDDLPIIRSMPGVKRVSYIVPAKAGLRNSVPWIGVPMVWDSVGNGDNTSNGEPVSIAIVDSGIDYFHHGFGGLGDPAEFAANDPTQIEPGSFPTSKVIGGIDFAGADNDAYQIDPDPVGAGSFHGTHVAGIAANIGATEFAAGVAPGADLYAVKVFADNGGTTTLAHLGIEWSLDPNQDGDTSDHADVINLSLGSDYGQADDITTVTANTASRSGAVVVASAGNGGNLPYIHASPAVAKHAISVANSVPGGEFQGLQMMSAASSASGLFRAVEGDHPRSLSLGHTLSGKLVIADSLDGCSELSNPDDVAGNVVLMVRGGCAFDDKYHHAELAGATGLIVFNDGTDESRIEPITMVGIDASRTITGLMVSYGAGIGFITAIGQVETVSAYADSDTTVPSDPYQDDTLADSTSRGPGLDNSFKPDVSAPGTSIVSISNGSGTGVEAATGTSMAAPHVAGVAGLLKQKWPKLKPAAIKAMLQNSSAPTYRDGAAGASDPYPLTLQGVGRVQADVASTLTSYASPGGVSFGRVIEKWDTHLTRKITVRNLSQDDKAFRIRHQENQTMNGVSISSYVSDLLVPGGDTRTFKIAMDFAPRQASFDSTPNSQREVDGWFVLEDELSDETLRIGYMAVVDPASGAKAFHSHNGLGFYNAGGSDSYAEGFTLADKANTRGQPRESQVIESFGYRTGVTLFGAPAIDFAFVSRKEWSSLSPLIFFLDIDSDSDGVYETTLQIGDFIPSQGFDGISETFVFPGRYRLGQANYDFNDRVATARFLIDRNAVAPNIGFLDPGDSDFGYQLTLLNVQTGASSRLSGHIDLSREVKVDKPSFRIPVDTAMTTELLSQQGGRMLWLYPQNKAKQQPQIINVRKPRY